MKKVIAFSTALCMLASLAGCGGNAAPTSSAAATESTAQGETGQTVSDDLMFYSTVTGNDLSVLLELLEKRFPDLNVEVVNDTVGELIARINAERNNPQGDVMQGGLDASDGDYYTDLFKHWLSDYESIVPEEYKPPNSFYNMDYLSTAAFCVNSKLEKDLGLEIDSYKDLLDPKLSDKVLLADLTSSSSMWNSLSNIMSVYGNDSKESWDYIERILKNKLVIASSSSTCLKNVESGEYVVDMTYEDDITTLMESGAQNIKLVYPKEGTSTSVFGTTVFRGAPHAENAKAAISYIMNPEGQKALGGGLGTPRMTTPETIDSKYLPATESIKWVKHDTKWLTENKEQVLEHWTNLYTN